MDKWVGKEKTQILDRGSKRRNTAKFMALINSDLQSTHEQGAIPEVLRHADQTSSVAHSSSGFTLIELLIVVFMIALSSAVAVMSLRPSQDQQNLQNAQQLAALLDSIRASARAQKIPMLWMCDQSGLSVQGASPSTFTFTAQAKHYNWQSGSAYCDPAQGVIGAEPIVKAQSINVYNSSTPEKASSDVNTAVQIATDGLGPFKLIGQ